jgi:hypothetical protein
MTPRFDLLPQDKGDDDAIERLRQLPEAELLPLLPKLLGCIADGNWLIAWGARQLMLPHIHYLETEIMEVLLGTDDIWKSNVLRMIQASTLSELPIALRQITERIAYHPTAGELGEETDEDARDLLAHFA